MILIWPPQIPIGQEGLSEGSTRLNPSGLSFMQNDFKFSKAARVGRQENFRASVGRGIKGIKGINDTPPLPLPNPHNSSHILNYSDFPFDSKHKQLRKVLSNTLLHLIWLQPLSPPSTLFPQQELQWANFKGKPVLDHGNSESQGLAHSSSSAHCRASMPFS